jgi:hypothetical protein
MILYRLTSVLGWFFHEIFFAIVYKFYIVNSPPKIIEWILHKIYNIGNWFYNINKNN